MGRSTKRTATASNPKAITEDKLWWEEDPNKNPHHLSDSFMAGEMVDSSRWHRFNDFMGSMVQSGKNVSVAMLLRLKSSGVAVRSATSHLILHIKSIDLLRYLCIIKTVTKKVTLILHKPKEGKTMANEPKNNSGKNTAKATTNSKPGFWQRRGENLSAFMHSDFVLAILGLGLALVFLSVLWMMYTIYMGTESPMSRIMMAPAAVFELTVVAIAFGKIFKR